MNKDAVGRTATATAGNFNVGRDSKFIIILF